MRAIIEERKPAEIFVIASSDDEDEDKDEDEVEDVNEAASLNDDAPEESVPEHPPKRLRSFEDVWADDDFSAEPVAKYGKILVEPPSAIDSGIPHALRAEAVDHGKHKKQRCLEKKKAKAKAKAKAVAKAVA